MLASLFRLANPGQNGNYQYKEISNTMKEHSGKAQRTRVEKSTAMFGGRAKTPPGQTGKLIPSEYYSFLFYK